MLKLKRLVGTFAGCLLAIILFTAASAENDELLGDVGDNRPAIAAQNYEKTQVPLDVRFSRAFGAPADGSWDGLFSAANTLDPVKYATEKPEQTIFKSAQYALSSATSGDEIWYGSAASVWCYWPYVSMKMPVTLMNHETPNHGCQITPPS